eukprot:jgi/Bigna1/69894/fgenesh1_pg.10_\
MILAIVLIIAYSLGPTEAFEDKGQRRLLPGIKEVLNVIDLKGKLTRVKDVIAHTNMTEVAMRASKMKDKIASTDVSDVVSKAESAAVHLKGKVQSGKISATLSKNMRKAVADAEGVSDLLGEAVNLGAELASANVSGALPPNKEIEGFAKAVEGLKKLADEKVKNKDQVETEEEVDENSITDLKSENNPIKKTMDSLGEAMKNINIASGEFPSGTNTSKELQSSMGSLQKAAQEVERGVKEKRKAQEEAASKEEERERKLLAGLTEKAQNSEECLRIGRAAPKIYPLVLSKRKTEWSLPFMAIEIGKMVGNAKAMGQYGGLKGITSNTMLRDIPDCCFNVTRGKPGMRYLKLDSFAECLESLNRVWLDTITLAPTAAERTEEPTARETEVPTQSPVSLPTIAPTTISTEEEKEEEDGEASAPTASPTTSITEEEKGEEDGEASAPAASPTTSTTEEKEEEDGEASAPAASPTTSTTEEKEAEDGEASASAASPTTSTTEEKEEEDGEASAPAASPTTSITEEEKEEEEGKSIDTRPTASPKRTGSIIKESKGGKQQGVVVGVPERQEGIEEETIGTPITAEGLLNSTKNMIPPAMTTSETSTVNEQPNTACVSCPPACKKLMGSQGEEMEASGSQNQYPDNTGFPYDETKRTPNGLHPVCTLRDYSVF